MRGSRSALTEYLCVWCLTWETWGSLGIAIGIGDGFQPVTPRPDFQADGYPVENPRLIPPYPLSFKNIRNVPDRSFFNLLRLLTARDPDLVIWWTFSNFSVLVINSQRRLDQDPSGPKDGPLLLVGAVLRGQIAEHFRCCG